MNKLIKLSETHYIVVDDSEIKEGEKVIEKYADGTYKLSEATPMSIAINKDLNDKFQFKITHSTEPLEYNGYSTEDHKYYENIKPLSLTEVEEVINGYSVEKMGEDTTNLRILKHKTPNQVARQYFDGYVDGFNTHKELVKDKFILSEDDLHRILDMARLQGEESFLVKHTNEEIIQSLLPKTEWDIEITPEGKIVLL